VRVRVKVGVSVVTHEGSPPSREGEVVAGGHRAGGASHSSTVGIAPTLCVGAFDKEVMRVDS
jgi:hypothetical protein